MSFSTSLGELRELIRSVIVEGHMDDEDEMSVPVLQDEKLSPVILRALSKNPDINVRLWVASRKTCPRDVLIRLATDDPELQVRIEAAKNPGFVP